MASIIHSDRNTKRCLYPYETIVLFMGLKSVKKNTAHSQLIKKKKDEFNPYEQKTMVLYIMLSKPILKII